MFCTATTSAGRLFGVDRAESPGVWALHAGGQVLCGASGAGASPGDGVFVPVSPVYLLTRPNRMTVSPGTRAGTTITHRTYCPFRSLQRTRQCPYVRWGKLRTRNLDRMMMCALEFRAAENP